MKAIVTGASSGIGECFARRLDEMGYDVVLVARREDRLQALAKTLKNNTAIVVADLAKVEDLEKVCKIEDADLLINNAGFGKLEQFALSDLQSDLDMIDLNIKSLHILCHTFINKFLKKGSGSILNVASIAGFAPSPLMATYYATKGYVVRLTQGIFEELRRTNRNVKISALCPGPVDTEFNDVADLSVKIKGLSADYVAKYALKKHFKGKLIIVPGFSVKMLKILQKILPTALMLRLGWAFQSKKTK